MEYKFNEKIEDRFIIVLTILLSILFLWMIKSFLIPLILAAITAGLTFKLYRFISLKLKKRSIAAFLTITIVFLIFIIPLAILTTVVVDQAASISKNVVPFIQNEIAKQGGGELTLPEWVPFRESIDLSQDNLVSKVQNIMGRLGNIFVNGLASLTQSTFVLILNLFVYLYAMFFFLLHGTKYLAEAKKYIPLTSDDVDQLLEQFTSVTRATLKGALLIGILQGSLIGAAFYVLGIKGAAFWGTISIVLSIIPSIGSGLVWFPAAIWLFSQGNMGGAIGLFVWGAGFVGTIDNVLRPRLVGDDTKMSDLIILLSTLGGISLFGFVGFIIGPLIAGLVLTMWNIYKEKLILDNEIEAADERILITTEVKERPADIS